MMLWELDILQAFEYGVNLVFPSLMWNSSESETIYHS